MAAPPSPDEQRSAGADAAAAGSTAAATVDVITDAIIPPVDELRERTDPIALFSPDYDGCNGIVSEMTPSLPP